MPRSPREQAGPRQAECLRVYDMVVTADGDIGLLVELSIRPLGCAVQMGTGAWDGTIAQCSWRDLRRATVREIQRAGLWGVGCNQRGDV